MEIRVDLIVDEGEVRGTIEIPDPTYWVSHLTDLSHTAQAITEGIMRAVRKEGGIKRSDVEQMISPV